jgi:pyruvate dehydrogenase E1 component alpha subunit
MIAHVKQDSISFDEKIASHFNNGRVRAPIHFYYGNKKSIIRVFENITPENWVFCSWLSHYQCLLKGVPVQELESAIYRRRSIALCFPKIIFILRRLSVAIFPLRLE